MLVTIDIAEPDQPRSITVVGQYLERLVRKVFQNHVLLVTGTVITWRDEFELVLSRKQRVFHLLFLEVELQGREVAIVAAEVASRAHGNIEPDDFAISADKAPLARVVNANCLALLCVSLRKRRRQHRPDQTFARKKRLSVGLCLLTREYEEQYQLGC